ncbi:MAG: hypothetical protein LBO73_02550 [Holosporaceae bacterium]|jgi:uncharacterized membrane-anchored protein|nr:hypothetical protein [Holosporaceae bacterium]
MLSLLRIMLFLFLVGGAIYYGGVASFEIKGNSISIHLAAVIFILGILSYLCRSIGNFIRRLFARKPGYEKGLEGLQAAFSAILLKDKVAADKFLKKSEKYLGNIPLILWLKGQRSLIDGDESSAKAIFYALGELEKDTALGACGLCRLAIKENSDRDALAALNSALKISPNAQGLILQAIAISVRNKNFVEAKKHLGSLKKSNKSRLTEAIVYAEEGIGEKNIDLLKKAFKLAPELSENAVAYAELLLKNEEYKSARKVLSESFKAFPDQKVFRSYAEATKDLSLSEQARLVVKLANAVPESWTGYFESAKFFMREGMWSQAFQNLLTAYEKEPFDFIVKELRKVAEKSEGTELQRAAAEVLSTPLKSEHVIFIWKCGHCGAEENVRQSVCSCCNRIGEYCRIQKKIPLLVEQISDFRAERESL